MKYTKMTVPGPHILAQKKQVLAKLEENLLRLKKTYANKDQNSNHLRVVKEQMKIYKDQITAYKKQIEKPKPIKLIKKRSPIKIVKKTTPAKRPVKK